MTAPRRLRRRDTLSAEPHVVYAIGDVHGCLDLLLELEVAIAEDARDRAGVKLIVMLGDYVDRGPNPAGVLDHLISPPPPGLHRLCLLGNHDAAFLDVLEGRATPRDLLALGGAATFASYGCDLEEYANGLNLNGLRLSNELSRLVPPAHLGFIRGLPISLEMPSFFFAHAGVRPGVYFAEQSEDDLLWIRELFLRGTDTLGKIVVHGHTISPAPVMDRRRIGVDTGACFGGPLTAARITRDGVSFISVS